MRRQAQSFLREALTFPEEERTEIAGALLESLEPEPGPEVEAAWRREVAARVAALDAEEVRTTPWEEIRDRLLVRVSERRKG